MKDNDRSERALFSHDLDENDKSISSLFGLNSPSKNIGKEGSVNDPNILSVARPVNLGAELDQF